MGLTHAKNPKGGLRTSGDHARKKKEKRGEIEGNEAGVRLILRTKRVQGVMCLAQTTYMRGGAGHFGLNRTVAVAEIYDSIEFGKGRGKLTLMGLRVENK